MAWHRVILKEPAAASDYALLGACEHKKREILRRILDECAQNNTYIAGEHLWQRFVIAEKPKPTRKLRWRACYRARRLCCRFQARRKSRTSKEHFVSAALKIDATQLKEIARLAS